MRDIAKFDELGAEMGDCWAITSYFNLGKSRYRRRNFCAFRAALELPLLVVELSFDGQFEIQDHDADIVVRLTTNDVLWHKEALLNYGVLKLPVSARYVAWLDSDIIFSRNGWSNEAVRMLNGGFSLVQPFSDLWDLDESGDLQAASLRAQQDPGKSFAYLWQSGLMTNERFVPPRGSPIRKTLYGLAWVARRSTLVSFPLYPMMIVGSGDRAVACAATDNAESVRLALKLSDVRYRHFSQWARGFYDHVQGKVGYVDGVLVHQWHGDLADRRYRERHEGLAEVAFDPYADVQFSGPLLRFLDRDSAAASYCRNYLSSRSVT